MDHDDGRTRIVNQFSYRGEHAAIWKAFDLFLPTDQFLNVGYSKPYQPHFVGSSQRRLAERMGTGIAARVGSTTGVPLLDVGCGRGGPTLHLTAEHGFETTGIDLVPYNISVARQNAADATADVAFVVGNALRLPFARGSFIVCIAIDSPQYIPNKRRLVTELSSVVSESGLVAVSDFVRPKSPSREARDAVDAFADAWELAPIPTLEQYKRAIAASDLHLDTVVDISPNSIARFRKWTALYLFLARSGLPNQLNRFLARRDVDLDTITEQVSTTHPALPFLRHVIIYAQA